MRNCCCMYVFLLKFLILPQLIKKVCLDLKERPYTDYVQSEKKLLVISCQTRVREAEGLCCFIYVLLLLRTFCGNKNTKHRFFEHSWTVRLKCTHSPWTNSYSNADADKEKQEMDFQSHKCCKQAVRVHPLPPKPSTQGS